MGNILQICALTLALLLTTSSSVFGQTDEKHLITPGQGIGPIKLGMSIEAVKFILGPTKLVTLHHPHGVDIAYGAWPAPASSGKFSVIFSTTFPITCGRAIAVGIDADPGYATAEGVRVGSTMEEIRGAFGEPTKIKHEMSDPDLIEYIERGITLSISKDKVGTIFVCHSVDECSYTPACANAVD